MPKKPKVIYFDLGRFKREKSGVSQLASIIEQAETARRKDLLEKLEEQDAELFKRVTKTMLRFSDFIYLEPKVLTEILQRVPALVLAYALKETPKDFQKFFMDLVSPEVARQVRDELQTADRITRDHIEGARKRIIRIARQLEERTQTQLDLSGAPSEAASN